MSERSASFGSGRYTDSTDLRTRSARNIRQTASAATRTELRSAESGNAHHENTMHPRGSDGSSVSERQARGRCLFAFVIASTLVFACSSDHSGATAPAMATAGAAAAGATAAGGAPDASAGSSGARASAGSGGVNEAGAAGLSAGGGGTSPGGSSFGGAVSGGASAAGAGATSGGTSSTGGVGGAQTNFAVQFANTIIARWPDPRTITGVTRGWDYNNGIVLRGMAEVYAKTQDPKYLAYIKKYVDYFVTDAGVLYVDSARTAHIEAQTHSLDLILPAGLLLVLAKQYPTDKRYANAASIVRKMFDAFPVNGDGGYWHKQSYPNEMWLDGIYMAEPFLVSYGAQNSACGAFCNDTPVKQATLLASHTQQGSGLLLHGWDFDHNASWCTGACAGTNGTGLSPAVWGRALGWFAMSLVDILPVLPSAHPGHASLLALLASLAAGAQSTQDPATGLWCEVVDQCSKSDNWTESSGSGMLIYALKVGVARGYLEASYGAVAERAWQGLKAKKIGSDALGPTIKDAADGASIQASYAGYIAIPKVVNSYHGLCAVQLAAAAMEY
jgi:unsaturated rhamnogalacturonyl hydrolase